MTIKEFFQNNLKYIRIFCVGGALGFGITFLFPAKTVIKIVKEGKTESTYKKNVDKTDQEQLYKCYESKIKIDAQTKDNNMIVTAEDECKKSIKSFEMSCQSAKKNSLIISYSPLFNKNFQLGHQGSVSYYRDIFGSFSIGIGITGQYVDQFAFGGNIGIMYKF